ncbi:MAG TPA: gluconate 2-dehydrogenase subunit 3 family protein [Bryobacteraceae bacterium]|jgi:hypothetical protein
MKRRRFFQSAIALPVGSALLAQEAVKPASTASVPVATPHPAPPTYGSANGSGMEYPKIETEGPDQASTPVLHFFSPAQYAALKRLSDLLMPSGGELAGALDARVPEFLDFYVGKSPVDRQDIYTAGLDLLNHQSTQKYRKPFADLNDSEAAALIAPAVRPWNYVAPADPLAHFLEEARREVRAATMNSREYLHAAASEPGARGGRGGRRQGGVGLYWYPLD